MRYLQVRLAPPRGERKRNLVCGAVRGCKVKKYILEKIL